MAESDSPFGSDPIPGIVAVEALPETGEAVVLQRIDGRVIQTSMPLKPYFFLSNASLLRGFDEDFELETLEGGGHYRYLAVFQNSNQVTRAREQMGRALGKSVLAPGGSELERAGLVMSLKNPASAFLARNGMTLFGGMEFEALRRLQIDIEVYTSAMPDGERYYFASAARSADRVIAIGMSDSDGWEVCLSALEYDEPEMLRSFVRLVQERDPDVIEVFNASFDLDFLQRRADHHGIALELGREWNGKHVPMDRRAGPASRGEHDPLRDADDFLIFGRQVVDVYLSLFKFDQFTRSLRTHSLKDAASHFALNHDRDRTFLNGEEIADTWDTSPDRVLKYCMDDVRDTRSLSALLLMADYRLGKLVPANLQRLYRLGMSTIVNLLMVRSYLTNHRSLPRSRRVTTLPEAFRETGRTGVAFHSFRVGIHCLHATMMLNERLGPASDELNIYLSLLEMILEESRRSPDCPILKNGPDTSVGSIAMEAAGEGCRALLRALAHAFYAYLLTTSMPFNDPAIGARVASRASNMLEDLLRAIRFSPHSRRVTVIHVGADGMILSADPPLSLEDENAIVASLREKIPVFMDIVHDGRWRGVFFRSPGHHAVLGYDGTLQFSGALRSRQRELILRKLEEDVLKFTLSDRAHEIWPLIGETKRRIRNRDLRLEDVARTETCRESLEDYQDLVARSARSRQVVYELAMRSDGRFGAGDAIRYYIAGSDVKRPLHELAEFAYRWDPQRANVAYLLQRLDEAMRRLLREALPEETVEAGLAVGEGGLF